MIGVVTSAMTNRQLNSRRSYKSTRSVVKSYVAITVPLATYNSYVVFWRGLFSCAYRNTHKSDPVSMWNRVFVVRSVT